MWIFFNIQRDTSRGPFSTLRRLSQWDLQQERDTFEPDYIKNYGENVGNQNEALIRVKSLDSYFKDLEGTSEFDIKNVKSAMDWGGADGRFLPSLSKNCEKYVYEVSSIEPLQGITRKQVLTDFDNYDYIQIAHVMEHVSNPFEFLKDPLKHLAKDGYLYVEVPLEIERPESIIEDAISGKIYLRVHEHINKYTANSLKKLVLAHGLSVVNIATDDIDYKYCKMKAIRLLARKVWWERVCK